ncbi:MAG: hypothetical protein GY845_03000 [Planctomycetes bacterium]|nr:hypothetical protein [Planctomycetota bacterium]
MSHEVFISFEQDCQWNEGFAMRLKYPLMLIVILCVVNCLICDLYASDSLTLSIDSPNGEVSKQITRPETQNRLFKEQNQDLLNTLHRAIGFIPLLIITILGLISYFTHRRYEQDKMLLICVIKSEIAKVRAGFERRYSDFEKKMKDDLQEQTKSLEQSHRRIAESISSDVVKPIDERTKILMGSRIILQMEFSALEAEQQMNKGQLTNAIRCWFDVAQKAWAINWKWRVAYALDKINYLLEKGTKITLQSSKTEWAAFLQSLPPQFEPLVKAIQSKI